MIETLVDEALPCVLDDGAVRSVQQNWGLRTSRRLRRTARFTRTGELEEVTRLDPNLGRWHLSLVESELRGAPLHYPTRWAAEA